MKNLNRILLVAIVAGSLLSSCELLHNTNQQEEPKTEYSSTFPISGEWYVQYNHAEKGEDPFGKGITKAFSYNTSEDDGKNIWFTDTEKDKGNFWKYKVKVPCDVENLTFGSNDTLVNNINRYNIKVVVKNGKIMKNASLQPSGAYTDSLYFEVWFEDLKGALESEGPLLVSGFRRTGFLEDEH